MVRFKGLGLRLGVRLGWNIITSIKVYILLPFQIRVRVSVRVIELTRPGRI